MADDPVGGVAHLLGYSGILKILEEVLSLIAFVCVVTSDTSVIGYTFMAVAVVALILTGVLIVSYLTYLVENLPLPWFKVEFLYCGFIAACYVILAILLFVQGGAAYIAGGVVTILGALVYAADGYHKFNSM